jgi:hypothetical protein
MEIRNSSKVPHAPRRLTAIVPAVAMGCLMAFTSAARAAFPFADMDAQELGLQYGLAFRGQNITNADVPAYETLHSLTLGYAPIPYLAVEAGLGLDRLQVNSGASPSFRGEFGISPSLGLILSSPYFAYDQLHATAGLRGLFLNSEDDEGYRYSGWIGSPFLGLGYAPAPFCAFEAGMRAHLIDGAMHGPGGAEKPFSNQEIVRGYFSATVKAPAERVFLTIDADVSPGLDSDWSHGPREAQVGISFGAVLGSAKPAIQVADSSRYFPDFNRLRERLRKMAGEIE